MVAAILCPAICMGDVTNKPSIIILFVAKNITLVTGPKTQTVLLFGMNETVVTPLGVPTGSKEPHPSFVRTHQFCQDLQYTSFSRTYIIPVSPVRTLYHFRQEAHYTSFVRRHFIDFVRTYIIPVLSCQDVHYTSFVNSYTIPVSSGRTLYQFRHVRTYNIPV